MPLVASRLFFLQKLPLAVFADGKSPRWGKDFRGGDGDFCVGADALGGPLVCVSGGCGRLIAAPTRDGRLPPSSGGRDTPDATSLGERGKGRRSPYGREMGTRIPRSPPQAPVTAPFRQGGHCGLPRAAAPTRGREPRKVLPLGKGGKAGAALVGRRRS